MLTKTSRPEDVVVDFDVAQWQAQGPFGVKGQGMGLQEETTVSGAVQVIAVHPTDVNKVFIGTVNGGVLGNR